MKLSKSISNIAGMTDISNAGFGAGDFQLGWYFGASGPFADVMNVRDEDVTAYFANIKAKADELGFEIFQTHGSFSGQVSSYPGGPAEYVRRAELDFIATKALGAKYCVQHPYINLNRRYDVCREQSIEEAIAVYREYIPALEKTGVICCLENMHHSDLVYKHRCCTTLSRAQEMADMCDVLGENFAICLDIGHCTVTEDDPIEAIEICGDRLVCLHTHDNDGIWDLHSYPFNPQSVWGRHRPKKTEPIKIDWVLLMKTLKKVGYKGTLNFEIGCIGPVPMAFYRYLAAIGRYLSDIFENYNHFTFDADNFYYNGEKIRIISGAMHYFRIPREYWRDRLLKLKACGFNTLETYTCWNLHERKEGQFDFSGNLDLVEYIKLAGEIGLKVIVRPGPYICSEWDFGGLPSWLLAYDNIAIRCNDDTYINKVKPYYDQLLSRLKPLQCTNGGPIIMMQVENEYGSYGDDQEYLARITRHYRRNGIDCQLFTSDGPTKWMLSGGSIPGLLSVANFGSNVPKNYEAKKWYHPDQPFMCGELWCGWFDHWYEEHHTRPAAEVVEMLEDFFKVNGNFNFYMFHGGTNFAFTNGANHSKGKYMPTITSYDYNCPLSEAGDMTDMYYAVREIIEKHTGVKAPDIKVENSKKAAYGEIELTEMCDLMTRYKKLASPVRAAYPQTMEQLGQDFGYLLYKTEIVGPVESSKPLPLVLTHLHDRAHIFIDGKLVGIRERSQREDEVFIDVKRGEKITLEILVENMGRVNYGPEMFDKKGIVGGVRIGQRFHFGWDHYSLPMEDLSALKWTEAEASDMPTFYKGNLKIEGTPCDTFIKTSNFDKGIVIVNGYNLGRYYNPAGPTKTLYLPAPFLKEGDNEIIVFETDCCKKPVITSQDTPEL